jgi:hypothetical protein
MNDCPSSLFQMRLVAKGFNDMVEPVIYRSITLSSISSSWVRVKHFTDRILNEKDSISFHVRELEIECWDSDGMALQTLSDSPATRTRSKRNAASILSSQPFNTALLGKVLRSIKHLRRFRYAPKCYRSRILNSINIPFANTATVGIQGPDLGIG